MPQKEEKKKKETRQDLAGVVSALLAKASDS